MIDYELFPYDFHRCSQCGRLITLPEELRRYRTGAPCKCGCRRYKPCNIEWYHWFLPRVMWFALLRYRGKV